MNYYNEIDKKAAAWLRELIVNGLIPKGRVDERDIREIRPRELEGFAQCHFFAGIGGWSYALRLANWPESKSVWTGSCPCQPFSIAGQSRGTDDERHLWPAFRWLIAQCRPSIVFGEQVASADGRKWLSGVRVDLESMGYDVGAADLCAAGVGSPHIRQRLWWVADSTGSPRAQHERESRQGLRREAAAQNPTECENVVDWTRSVWLPCRDGKQRRVPARGIPNTEITERGPVQEEHARWWTSETGRSSRGIQAPGYDRLEAEPTLFPLADGVSDRMGLLRGAGNAIVPEVAERFIEACVVPEVAEKFIEVCGACL